MPWWTGVSVFHGSTSSIAADVTESGKWDTGSRDGVVGTVEGCWSDLGGVGGFGWRRTGFGCGGTRWERWLVERTSGRGWSVEEEERSMHHDS